MSDVLIPKPVKTRRHIGQAISLRGLRSEIKRVDGVNAKIAVFLTNIVGSMWCNCRLQPPGYPGYGPAIALLLRSGGFPGGTTPRGNVCIS